MRKLNVSWKPLLTALIVLIIAACGGGEKEQDITNSECKFTKGMGTEHNVNGIE